MLFVNNILCGYCIHNNCTITSVQIVKQNQNVLEVLEKNAHYFLIFFIESFHHFTYIFKTNSN